MALVVKNLPANARDVRNAASIPGLGRSLGRGHDNYSILAWRIPLTEEPGRLQSIGSNRVRHNWVTKHTHTPQLYTITQRRCKVICHHLILTISLTENTVHILQKKTMKFREVRSAWSRYNMFPSFSCQMGL